MLAKISLKNIGVILNLQVPVYLTIHNLKNILVKMIQMKKYDKIKPTNFNSIIIRKYFLYFAINFMVQ